MRSRRRIRAFHVPVEMKYFLIAGARPNFMKIAPIHRAFCSRRNGHSPADLLLVHTGQHYGGNMSDDFFRDLGIPEPDIKLEAGSGSHAEQTARIMMAFEPACLEHRPDWAIVVGDVNSTIACALTRRSSASTSLTSRLDCARAICRCRRRSTAFVRMPFRTFFFTTDTLAVDNLLNEGVASERIHFVGNTMIDTLLRQIGCARERPLPDGLAPGQYIVLTLHRPANVDSPTVWRLFSGRSVPSRIACRSSFPSTRARRPGCMASNCTRTSGSWNR